MKKINFKIIIILFVISNIMISCTTAMNFDKSATLQESMQGINTEMEFIGFKGTYDTLGSDYNIWQNFEKDTVLSKLGNVLQDKGIAFNQSFAYVGTYSLQDMATYKNKQRFVTFVETERNHFYYTYNNTSQMIWGGISAGSLLGGITTLILYSDPKLPEDYRKKQQGFSIGVSLVGLAALIPALTPAKTSITFNGVYSIYVYDTKNKEIIYKDTVSVGPLSDKYTGSFDHENTDKNAVLNYYSTLAYNAIIKKYDEIYKFLETKK